MRVVPTVACLALTLAACQAATPSAAPSASLPVTDLSSLHLPSPLTTQFAVTPTAVPPLSPAPITFAPTTQPTPTSLPSATPIELGPTVTPAPLASPAAGATPDADCVNGWLAPAAGSPEYDLALEMMQSQMAVTGPWNVDEMRYFTGPDVPWILDPHYDVVDYWYVRASRAADPLFKGRWLLEQRTELIRGISAVAPYDTNGYASPNWTGFAGDGPPQIYAGLPGEWAGVPYDFVTGKGDSGEPGLPVEVVGCLSGT